MAARRRVEQAGIAVGIEAIAGRDGVGVGGLHGVEAAEGRDQHEQRRARQMEVGHQHVDGPEPVAGRDEERRLAGERRGSCHRLAGGRLQQPQRRGADGDDAPAGGARGVEGRGGVGGDLAPLGVHAVLGGVVGLDGQEGAGADVQRHEMAGDAARVQRRQQRRA